MLYNNSRNKKWWESFSLTPNADRDNNDNLHQRDEFDHLIDQDDQSVMSLASVSSLNSVSDYRFNIDNENKLDDQANAMDDISFADSESNNEMHSNFSLSDYSFQNVNLIDSNSVSGPIHGVYHEYYGNSGNNSVSSNISHTESNYSSSELLNYQPESHLKKKYFSKKKLARSNDNYYKPKNGKVDTFKLEGLSLNKNLPTKIIEKSLKPIISPNASKSSNRPISPTSEEILKSLSNRGTQSSEQSNHFSPPILARNKNTVPSLSISPKFPAKK